MINRLNKFLDDLSEFLANRKGLLPFIGILFVIINAAFQFFPIGWLTETNLFLHVGIVVAVLGIMLAWAL